jgi:hypothetical protein
VGAIGTSWLINGLGQRIAQINVSVPEFFFVYDEAGHLTGKYDGGGNLLQETVWLGDLPVAVLQPGGRFYIAPDHLGARKLNPHTQRSHKPFTAGRVLGAGLWSPFFNFHFGGAETGSIADRDRFAGDPWRVRRTPARLR